MFKPMKKTVNLGEGKPKLVLRQDQKGDLTVRFLDDAVWLILKADNKAIAALGFPTEPIEETVEEIDGVIE